MIYNVGSGGGSGNAESVSYDNTQSGLSADNVQDAVDEVTGKLTSGSETFNYGIKNGVRGFYTDPSRADDSFVPFSNPKVVFSALIRGGSQHSADVLDSTYATYSSVGSVTLKKGKYIVFQYYANWGTTSTTSFTVGDSKLTGTQTHKTNIFELNYVSDTKLTYNTGIGTSSGLGHFEVIAI